MGNRLDYPKTFVLGLGFFAISLCWSLYNSFVPVFLDNALGDVALKGTLVGIIMTFDNIAAVTLQPYFGAASDRTWNRHGRRMPYILVGMPLGALFFALIPFFRHSLVPMITVLLIMNVSMAIFRAPTVALMPDVTPPELRSKANGVINLMGGFGGLLAFFVGSVLYRMSPTYPFIFAAVLMVFSVAMLKWRICEPKVTEGSGGQEEPVGILQAFKDVLADPDRSALRMLLAIFFWFIAWNGIEAFFTLYAREVWNISEATGALYLGFFSLALVACAIPAGFVATAIGRAKTIRIGIVGLAACLWGLSMVSQGLVPVLLALAGAFWALININSYPMVVDMATRSKTGAYTGLYYLFSSLAAITGPPIFGVLKDILGMRTLFPFSVLFAVVAFVFMMGVRRGDPVKA